MKLKTLGEMLAEDVTRPLRLSPLTVECVRYWLDRHNITDATPLVVEAVGTAVLNIVYEPRGDGTMRRGVAMRDIEGMPNIGKQLGQRVTVALLAEEGK